MKKSMSSSTTTSTATTSYKEKTFGQIWLSDSGVSFDLHYEMTTCVFCLKIDTVLYNKAKPMQLTTSNF